MILRSTRNRYLSIIIVLAAAPLALNLAGCTVAHTAESSHRLMQTVGLESRVEVTRQWDWVISRQSRIFFAYPEIRSDQHQLLPRLSQRVADELVQQARAGAVTMEMASPTALSADVRARALRSDYDYLFKLSGSASADPDQPFAERGAPELALQVWDLRSGRLVEVVTVRVAQGHLDRREAVTVLVEALLTALLQG